MCQIKLNIFYFIFCIDQDLRQELDRLLRQKINKPGMIQWGQDCKEGRIMQAIIDLITTEEEHDQADW